MIGKRVEVGDVFGDLITIEYISKKDNPNMARAMWRCSCKCGGGSLVDSTRLRSGVSRRCPRCAAKASGESQRTAKFSSSGKAYRAWGAMKNRCGNPNYEGYLNYGGRGITVCDEWAMSFDTFIDDMGEPLTSDHSIDRIDVNKGYSKDNCRWADWEAQANNRTTNVNLAMNGETKTIAEWSREINVDYETIRARISRGLSIDKVLYSGDLNSSYRYTTPNGEFFTIDEVVKSHSVPRSTVFNRFKSKKNKEWVKIYTTK